MNKNLVEAFKALKPVVAADFTRHVNISLGGLINKYGAKIGDVHSPFFGHDYAVYRSFCHMLAKTKVSGLAVYSIDADKVEKEATRYADEQVDSFIAKLTRKLGNVESVTIKTIDGPSFECVISGVLSGGETVRVEQRRVVNCSPKGRFYNQWPALIYVDGKRVTEAQFKKLTA
ncbi:MAG: hypothetical protein DDT26_00008 [Dehalococcoidia bacterium]|nr:hypothetical protein [Chloroflexota bacterium]